MARAISASGSTRLPRPESHAQEFSNLWSDMLINVRVARLQRERDPVVEPQMIRMWAALSSSPTTDRLWWVVLRAYEQLWSKPPGFLAPTDPPDAPVPDLAVVPPLDEGPPNEDRTKKAERIAQHRDALERLAAAQRELSLIATANPRLDASLLAETVRTFGDDPISGALRFGMIATPYLVENTEAHRSSDPCGGQLGVGPATPGELVAVLGDARLREKPEHPAIAAAGAEAGVAAGEGSIGGQSYGLAKTLQLYAGNDADYVIAAWYEAAARQWVRPMLQSAERERTPDATIPGALDEWSLGDDLADLDWPSSLSTGATIIPGVTTRRRDWLPDVDPDAQDSVQLDLYIDSSGSMTAPERESPAVLAGTILILSVLRGGGRVRVTSFSGAGQVAGGARFTRDRAQAMRDLCTYFGGATTFPLDVYGERYRGIRRRGDTRRHVVVLSDDGLESMFGSGQEQYGDVARQVRSVLDTGTLIVQDSRRSLGGAATAAGYDLEYIGAMQDAPAACARLAMRLTRTPEVERG